MGKTKYIDAEPVIVALRIMEKEHKENAHGDPFEAVYAGAIAGIANAIDKLPAADVVEVVRCKDCKHWRQQTNYQGAPLSFGFCESDDMWQSLYGETYEVEHIDTDDDFYCGYAKRRINE